ncbi:hypothetical protein [Brevundimonas diminuta]|uniref:hypothetical protein n=1 Tax=Brevundimonas diminuta TaxID=293 RepID=UPI003F7E44DD
MSLTMKQRVKVNAALATIHAHGLDPFAVHQRAVALRQIHEPRRAYEIALNEFAAQHPDVGVVVGNITRIVEAAPANDLVRYDHALNVYRDTGDDAAIDAIAESVLAAEIDLAVQAGELSAADAQAAKMDAARELAERGAPLSDGAKAALSREGFDFPEAQAPAQQALPAPMRPEDLYASQTSSPGVPVTGIVAPGAQARIDRDRASDYSAQGPHGSAAQSQPQAFGFASAAPATGI